MTKAPPTERRLTDLGNAQRLVDRHGNDFRHVGDWRAWLTFDGRRWDRDVTGEISRRAKDTARALWREASEASDADDRKARSKHASASESARGIRAMVELAATEPSVAIRSDRLDRDGWLFCAANGTVDLRTSQLREHRREDLITKISPVPYLPDAECPAWETFLGQVIADDSVIELLQRLVGYSLSGFTIEQVLIIMFGTGANGKSTFVEAVRYIAGDYGQQTPAETFLEQRQGIPADLARLRSARFVAAAETGDGHRLNEALVKRLTGGDTITARFLYGEWFEFEPEFTPWLATNHRPTIRGTDEAIWRRLLLIPFTTTIPAGQRDRDLPAKLRAEAPGILRWAIDGARLWHKHGLQVPDSVRAATSDYRATEDHLGQFIADCCHLDDHAWTPKGDLYKAYEKWAAGSGEEPLSKRNFGTSIRNRGHDETQLTSGNRSRIWLGLGLLDPQQDLL